MDITDVRVTVGADCTLIFTHMSTKIVYTYKHYDVGLHFLNVKRLQQIRIKNKKVRKLSNSIKETIEDGEALDKSVWVRGSLTSRMSKNKGTVYYHKDGVVKTFKPSDKIPAGWVKGNPQADSSKVNNLKGSSYYHNPVTGEEKRFVDNAPSDWVKGRVTKWVTNGVKNKQINTIKDSIPVGWKLGRTNKRKGK